MDMPFGRHRGQRLETVPTDYLAWLLTVNLRWWLREAVEAELARRYPAARPTPAVDVQTAVRRWFRELTLEFHPDRGGSHERQVALNLAHERLKELLGIE